MEQRLLLSLAEAHHLLRHDINNHLQVILGYMQLKKPEKAEEYLLRTIKSLQRFKLLPRLELPLLGMFLLSFLTRLGEHENVLHIQAENNMKDWLECDVVLTRLFMDILIPAEELCAKNELYCEIFFSHASEEKIGIFLQSKGSVLPEKLTFLHNLKDHSYQGLHLEIGAKAEEELYLTIFRDYR